VRHRSHHGQHLAAQTCSACSMLPLPRTLSFSLWICTKGLMLKGAGRAEAPRGVAASSSSAHSSSTVVSAVVKSTHHTHQLLRAASGQHQCTQTWATATSHMRAVAKLGQQTVLLGVLGTCLQGCCKCTHHPCGQSSGALGRCQGLPQQACPGRPCRGHLAGHVKRALHSTCHD
jgi:hypothetical protein